MQLESLCSEKKRFALGSHCETFLKTMFLITAGISEPPAWDHHFSEETNIVYDPSSEFPSRFSCRFINHEQAKDVQVVPVPVCVNTLHSCVSLGLEPRNKQAQFKWCPCHLWPVWRYTEGYISIDFTKSPYQGGVFPQCGNEKSLSNQLLLYPSQVFFH